MLRRTMRCSFCGRPDSEVAKLVAGPWRLAGRVFICDRCAAQTIQIMESHADDDQPRGATESVFRRALDRRLMILALVVAVAVVLVAKYFGLLGPVILGGQVASLAL
jgi:hypothetical protein